MKQRASNAARRAASARLVRPMLARPTVAPVAQYGVSLGNVDHAANARVNRKLTLNADLAEHKQLKLDLPRVQATLAFIGFDAR